MENEFTGGEEVSHIVTIKSELRDAEAVSLACKRLGLEEPRHGTAQLFVNDVLLIDNLTP